ncbi:acetylglutamate kinase [Streptomyces sp. NPDC059009]|uniref:amino acid kinase family protein n=1 Tax=Streptomyces sp. NPDC059009 TaxID=3346694 RepID=UPI003681562D
MKGQDGPVAGGGPADGRAPGTLVVKLGGSVLHELSSAWWDDLAALTRSGTRTVLVHGWSKQLAALDPAHGRPEAFVRDRHGNRSRLTTPGVLADIRQVSTSIHAYVADQLAHRDLTTHHILGSDGLLSAHPGERLWWQGRALVEIDNLVGPPHRVDATRLADAAAHADCTLVTPLARDPHGRVVNTDADRAAAALAAALRAPCLVLVTDVPHVLVGGRPVRRLALSAVSGLRREATGGMRKKLHATAEALRCQVPRVVIGNGPVSSLAGGRRGTLIEGPSADEARKRHASGDRHDDGSGTRGR